MTELNCINNKSLNRQEEKVEIEWSVADTLPSPDGVEEQRGLAGPVTGIIHDRLIVAGGANFPDGMPWRGAKKAYRDEIYLFEKKNGHLVNAIVCKERLPRPLAYCANVMTTEGLVYIGGENDKGISDRVVLMKYDETARKFEFSDLPSLPVPLTNLSAAYAGQKIYVAGGNSKDGTSSRFFSLDVLAPNAGWQLLPDVPVRISFAIMTFQSDEGRPCIYLIGGRRKNSNGISAIFNTIYRFNTRDSQWSQERSLPYNISAGTGIANSTNEILVFSGDKGETFHKEEMINAAINDEKDQQKREELVKKRIALLDAHAGFTREVLLYNIVTDTWKKLNPLPFGSVTTTAIKWGDEIIIPSGEIKAGVRTPLILMGKIVPSRQTRSLP